MPAGSAMKKAKGRQSQANNTRSRFWTANLIRNRILGCQGVCAQSHGIDSALLRPSEWQRVRDYCLYLGEFDAVVWIPRSALHLAAASGAGICRIMHIRARRQRRRRPTKLDSHLGAPHTRRCRRRRYSWSCGHRGSQWRCGWGVGAVLRSKAFPFPLVLQTVGLGEIQSRHRIRKVGFDLTGFHPTLISEVSALFLEAVDDRSEIVVELSSCFQVGHDFLISRIRVLQPLKRLLPFSG